jgi:hypothetical protein
MTEFIDFTTGSPARERDFFFRGAFVEDLWDSLRKEHVLILAPRRMGKTSVMLRLQDEPRQNRLVVFLNVEEIVTPAEFCQSLINAIHEQQPEYLRQTLARTWGFLTGILDKFKEVELYKFKIALRESDPNWEDNWKTKAEELVGSIRRAEQPLLIILDELPDMVLNMQKKGPEKLDTFLHWFRRVRQDPHQDNIRWLVGGSVNLRSTLDQGGKLNLINDLRVEPLPPFSDEEVDQFVKTMLGLRDVPFKPEMIDRVKRLLGKPIPFFLQLLIQELYRDWRRHHETLGPVHVDSVFNRVLLGETARDKLQHFRSRIYTHYPDDEKNAAFELLDRLSGSETPLSRDALIMAYTEIEGTKPKPRTGQDLKKTFHDLMLLLQNDFYVEEIADRQYDFASRTLKLWWRKYYG